MAKKMANMFKTQPIPNSNKKGGVGYDNARENIDPHVKTKVVSTKEVTLSDGAVAGYVMNAADGKLSGGHSVTMLWEVDGTETQLITADDIDMQTKKIINLVDPTANQEAATKKYVDDTIIPSLWKIDGTETQLKTADDIDMQGYHITMPDDTDTAFAIKEGAIQYLTFDTTNGSELITLEKNALFGGYATFVSPITVSKVIGTGVATTNIDLSSATAFNIDVNGNELLYVQNHPAFKFARWNTASLDMDFDFYGTGGAALLFTNAGTNRVGIGTNAPASKLQVAGAIASAVMTITASSDDLDVSGVNTVFINPAAAVQIGGLKGGVAGQVLYVQIVDADQNVTLEDTTGLGTQDICMHQGLDETLASECGGWILICDGTKWYDCSHARHV